MVSKKLKIVSVSAEVEPYSKTGGLAEVAATLPIELQKLGHQVVIVTPFYEALIDKEKFKIITLLENITINLDEKNSVQVSFYQTELKSGVKVYFIANHQYFGVKKELYGSKHENFRFALFDLAVLELLKQINFQPNVIHCHDWHCGLIPYYLKKYYPADEFFKNTAVVYTIHNLLYQSGNNWWETPPEKKDDGLKNIPLADDPDFEYVNFTKRAILNADIINTVSEQYAEEVMTKDFGEDLHRLLKNRKDKFFGIVNGIDEKHYNPATDPGLVKNYTRENFLAGKRENKKALQNFFNLPERSDVPVIGMVARIAEQKGVVLLLEIIHSLLDYDIQLILWGTGDKEYEATFRKIAKKHPEKFAVNSDPEGIFQRTTLVYAGSDVLLMPSRFEPCGLCQMISLRYGTIPVVHSTGGLADTISNFNPTTRHGNGFVFLHYRSQDLLMAITRALETYKYAGNWEWLVAKAMDQSFSWEIPARKYLKLYGKAIKFAKLKI